MIGDLKYLILGFCSTTQILESVNLLTKIILQILIITTKFIGNFEEN